MLFTSDKVKVLLILFDLLPVIQVEGNINLLEVYKNKDKIFPIQVHFPPQLAFNGTHINWSSQETQTTPHIITQVNRGLH